MKSYNIVITRDITESCYLTVEANSESDAEETALQDLSNFDDPKWEVDCVPSGSAPYVTGIEETNEEKVQNGCEANRIEANQRGA